MSTNSSREKDPNDRWSEAAKDHRLYWLCECGIARLSADKVHDHCQDNEHYAEYIDSESGKVLSFIAGGLSQQKYGTQIPDSALIKREKLKNDPMFER